jgi:MFS family permease
MSKFNIGLLGSIFFAGWCSTLLIFPPMADHYGRKKIYYVGTLINLVLMTLLLLSTNYWFTIVLNYFAGAFTTTRMSIGYTYTMELVSENHKTLYSTIWLVVCGAIPLTAVLYFTIISNDWFYLVAFGWVLNLIGCVVNYYLPESPTWLVKKGDFAKA